MARTFRLNKLVRDNIVALNESQGAQVEYKVLEGQELQAARLDKLQEEANELREGVTAKELADLQELLDTIAEGEGISREEIDEEKEEKRVKNGGFRAGHFVLSITLPDDSEWINYYAANPERFPEIEP